MAADGARCPLQQVLELLLPTEQARPLLHSILLAGDEQLAALRIATGSRDHGLGNSAAAREAARGLRPLLHHAVASRGIPCEPALLTLLRTAWVREDSRANALVQAARPLLEALTTGGIDHVLLKGVALAWSAYPQPSLRHCHDLDLLIPADSVRAAVSIAGSVGYTPDIGDWRPPGPTRLVHRRGLPLELHSTLNPEPYYSLPLPFLWTRSRERDIWGLAVRVLAPEDQLLHVLGLAAVTPQRHLLRWICDARFLLAATPGFDWDRFAAACVQARLELPAGILLRYLAQEVDVPVPCATQRLLDERVRAASPLARDVALAGTRAGSPDRLLQLRQIRSGWRTRAWALRWLLFPSPDWLHHTNQSGHGPRARRYLSALARQAARRAVSPVAKRRVTS